MMSTETIQALSRQAAVEACAYDLEPYVPANSGECLRYARFPFPNLGAYRPDGWTLVDWVMADSSGLGREDEPALTIPAMRQWCANWVNLDPTVGFGVIVSGEFQVYVGAFSQAPDAVAKEGDNGIQGAAIHWEPCPECGIPLEVGTTYCDCGWDADEPEDEDVEDDNSDAYNQGMDAYLDDKSQETNPYPVNSSEYLDWNTGFEWIRGKTTQMLKDLGQLELGLEG